MHSQDWNRRSNQARVAPAGLYPDRTRGALSPACGSGSLSSSQRGSRSDGFRVAARSAIDRFESVNDPPAGSWEITALDASSADPTYVLFRVGPTPGHQVQVGYGFAHEASGSWAVIGFGSAEVGCAPGAPDNAIIPKAVLAGFNLPGPTSG